MRTLQIFINGQFYKEIQIEARPDGSYNPAIVLDMLNKDRANGLLDSFGVVNGAYSIRMQLFH